MERKIVIVTLVVVVLATWFLLWRVLPFDLAREGEERGSQHGATAVKAAHLNEVMEEASRLLEISQVVSGGPELIGGAKPLAVYTVTLVREIPQETYFFERKEYTKDIGSEVETAKLCKTVATSAPRVDPPQSGSGSRMVDEAQFSLGPIQFPLSAFASDLARILGVVSRESSKSFKSLDILVKGFADGTVSNWELDLLGDPYHFQSIEILPQLDSKADLTPSKFAASSSVAVIGPRYKNEHLGNLRAAFVAQDIVAPMLGGCLEDKTVTVKILEGYVSRRPRNPMQRKVEVYLNFY